MGVLLRELKFALRLMRRRKAVALVGMATLAVALGANTAMFSVYSSMVLHPLPYPEPQRLAWMDAANTSTHEVLPGGLSPQDFLDLRSQCHQMATLAAYYPNVATLIGEGDPEHVAYANVSGEFFATLGVAPALGRTVQRADELPTLPEVAVLSDGLWRRRYGASPDIVGQHLDLDNLQLTIIGVMPPGFDYPPGTELWAPEPFANPANQERSFRFLSVIGRLKPGASLQSAQAETGAVAERLAAQYPVADAGRGAQLRTLSSEVVGPVGATLALMMLAAVLVLGIACVNVANMLLAQAVGRWREMALRSSLGATRSQLLRQLLTEGLVLAAAAGAAGWLLAALMMPVLRRVGPAGLTQLANVRMSGETLAFVALAVALTAICFGLAPVWELLRPQPGRSLLRMANPGAAKASRLPESLVAIEVAACVALVMGAGLLLQSVRQLQRADPGFDPGHAVTFRMSLLFNSLQELYADAPFFTRLNQQLQATPGIEAAGLTSALPFAPPVLAHYSVPGSVQAGGVGETTRSAAGLRRVLPGYFRAMGISLRGRDFDAQDNTQAGRVAIVSQRLAEAAFPGADALGKVLALGSGPKPINVQIVGVAGDVPEQGLGGAPGEDIYTSFLQVPNPDMSAVVRARGDPMELMPALRRMVAALNPQVALYDVARLDQVVNDTTAPDRFRAGLLAAMALLALLLAMVGVYGVLAHSVALRRQEIGIRMALGATVAQVRRMVLAQSLKLIAAGIVAGLMVAWALSRGLQRFMYQSGRGDLLAWAAAPLILLAAGLAASYWPAYQAAKVDPVITLRCE